MFRIIYLNLKRNLHIKLSEFYSTWIVEHPIITVMSYLILFVCLSLGLFQIQVFTGANEALTHVKNSEYVRNAQLIKETFTCEPVNRYFQQQLTDLGYYAEFIVKLKNTQPGQVYNASYNFLNESILNEYNQFYDEIFNLTIEFNNKNLTYRDFCPRRLNKCAIEGSLVRNPRFQEVLLNREAKYDKHDYGGVYIDASIVDGTSFDFVFGKERKQRCGKKDCYVTQVGTIRNRFDFLANNETSIKLALKFMHRYVEYLGELSKNDAKFKYITFSYHTSHTLDQEIEKYSLPDLKHVAVGFILFWFVYSLAVFFEFERVKLKRPSTRLSRRRDECQNEQNLSSNCVSLFEDSKFELGLSSVLVLVVVTFAQYLITIISTLGLMSLLGFVVNQLLYSIVFVLLTYRENLSSNSKETESQLFKQSVNEATQKILIPNLFALIASISAYSAIGLTSSFSSISIYCSFISMCLFLNFVGQLALYIPSLIIQLKRYDSPLVTNSSKETLQEKTNGLPTRVCDEFNLLNNEEKTLPKQLKDSIGNTQQQTIKSNSNTNNPDSKFNLVYSNKMKYLIFLLFISYSSVNLVLVVNNLQADLPLDKLMPSQSYLHAHYQNHQNHYGMGPMILLNFIKPLNYAQNETYTRISSFVEEVQNMPMISKFSLNWFLETKGYQLANQAQDMCHDERTCFYLGLKQTVSQDTNVDDVIIVNSTENPPKEIIKASRIYIQLKKFNGAYDEVELWDNMQALAEEKYNFDKNTLIIFTSIYGLIEQLREITPSVLAIFILSIESIFFSSLLLVFDLKSIFIQMAIAASLVLSILSNMYIFGLSLNIVTLFQLIMLPALLFEFLYYTVYLYLFNTDKKEINVISLTQLKQTTNQYGIDSASTSSNTSTNYIEEIREEEEEGKEAVDNEAHFNSNVLIRNQNIQFLMRSSTKVTFVYLLVIVGFMFGLALSCSTYNFHSLFVILTITCVNTLVHLCLFYPNLLILFGTSWKPIRSERL